MSDPIPAPLFYTPVTRWVPWFAWRPVNTVEHGWVWLRRVQRRRVQKKLSLPGPTDIFWQYAIPVEET